LAVTITLYFATPSPLFHFDDHLSHPVESQFFNVIPGLTKPAPYLIRGDPLPTGWQEYFWTGFPLEFIPMKIGAVMTA